MIAMQRTRPELSTVCVCAMQCGMWLCAKWLLVALLQDLKEGTGESPAEGDMVVIDWDGYTIG
jgi:hypothetical protein